jgi:hypothetical protein
MRGESLEFEEELLVGIYIILTYDKMEFLANYSKLWQISPIT